MINTIKIKNILSKIKKIIVNKKILITTFLLIIITLIFIFLSKDEQSITRAPDFLIDNEDILIESDTLKIIKTYPENNSESSAHTISIDFSKEVINKNISIRTQPYMNIDTKIFTKNPYKLFITPDKPWEYIDYKIIIRSDELQEDFILNIKFKEQEPPILMDERGLSD